MAPRARWIQTKRPSVQPVPDCTITNAHIISPLRARAPQSPWAPWLLAAVIATLAVLVAVALFGRSAPATVDTHQLSHFDLPPQAVVTRVSHAGYTISEAARLDPLDGRVRWTPISHLQPGDWVVRGPMERLIGLENGDLVVSHSR